ncbi:grpE protein homolog 1, mitochondrial-like [Sycon ciliatum]|uniref:grpE protein homolog 1, mitochondrial-like n=1 Tax=Sycon ciliatum TaxID=27933 RepID=UPI0031F67A0A
MMLRCVSQRVSGASFRQSVLQGQPSYHVPRTLFGRSANTSQIPTDQAASEQPQAGEGDSNAQLKAMEEKYTAELEKAEKSFKEVQNQLKRCLAETENVRKRAEKQVGDSRLFGIQKFAKDLLEVADILEKAIDSSPAKPSSAPEILAMHEGLAMTQTQLQKVFTSNGLVRTSPLGETFDPNLHEAIYQIPAAAAEGKKAGAIAAVARVGYTLNQRTLRAAQVGVVAE